MKVQTTPPPPHMKEILKLSFDVGKSCHVTKLRGNKSVRTTAMCLVHVPCEPSSVQDRNRIHDWASYLTWHHVCLPLGNLKRWRVLRNTFFKQRRSEVLRRNVRRDGTTVTEFGQRVDSLGSGSWKTRADGVQILETSFCDLSLHLRFT